MTDVSKRIEDMDRVGIDVEVVSLSTPNVFFTDAEHQPAVARMMNDSYAEAHCSTSETIQGFRVDPDGCTRRSTRRASPCNRHSETQRRESAQQHRWQAFDVARVSPFFEEANRMKLCIFLHPMIPAQSDAFREYVLGPIIGFPFDTSLAVARMCYDGMFEELPDIRWIIGHLGGAIPYLMERMDNGFRDFADCRVKIDKLPSVYLKRLYYDTVSFSPHTLKMVREMVGADHMVMGSDYPHLLGSIDRAVTSIEALEIDDREKNQIFSRTALSILNNI
jgi:aminocarboxymuconate-semialdehyde decarboxylase